MSYKDNAPLKKIQKKEVLIIKTSNGDVISFNHSEADVTDTSASRNVKTARPSVTHHAISDIEQDKKGNLYVLVGDGENQILNMRIVSENKKELAVSKWKKKYKLERYVIPDKVIIGNETYTVTEIDSEAFYNGGFGSKIKVISFPESLERIGDYAFYRLINLKRIDLPENLQEIGEYAFYAVGGADFEYIYIPKGVKSIGKSAFSCISNNISPRRNTQAIITSLPVFINENNSDYYGIDDSAVENYYLRQK